METLRDTYPNITITYTEIHKWLSGALGNVKMDMEAANWPTVVAPLDANLKNHLYADEKACK